MESSRERLTEEGMAVKLIGTTRKITACCGPRDRVRQESRISRTRKTRADIDLAMR